MHFMSSVLEPLSIVFSADADFSVPFGIALHSLLSHAVPGRKFDIHVLDGGVREDVKKIVDTWRDTCHFTIKYHDLRNMFLSCGGGSGHFTAAMYYRFLIPDLLPESVHRALYVDSDVMFMQDCGELFEQDLEGRCLGAVEDIYLAGLGDDVRHGRLVEDLGFPLDHAYYLSGQLLMDLDRMRAVDATRRLIWWAEEHSSRYRFPDQDVMNVVLEGDIQTIPCKWCVMPCFEREIQEGSFLKKLKYLSYTDSEITEAVKAPGLVHFAGGNKPDSTSPPATVLEAEFFRCRSETPWTNEPPYTPEYIKVASHLLGGTPEQVKRRITSMMRILRAVYRLPGAPTGYRMAIQTGIRLLSKAKRVRRQWGLS